MAVGVVGIVLGGVVLAHQRIGGQVQEEAQVARREEVSQNAGKAIVLRQLADQQERAYAEAAAEAKNFIEKSLKLFELARKYLSGDIIVKENFQLDYAASFYVAGQILLKSDKKAAEKYFLEAEKIWLPFLKNRDMKKQRDALVYYRTCWHLTKLYRDWGKEDLYKKYLNILPEKLRKGL